MMQAARSLADVISSMLDRMPTDTNKPAVVSTTFTPRFAECRAHGRWPENMLDANGVERWVPMCPQCRKEQQVRQLLAGADIPARFSGCSFDNYRADSEGQKKALAQCRFYASNFRQYRATGTGLILRGNPGTSKNHLITAIAAELMRDGYSVLRMKAQDYLDAYWSTEFSDRGNWLRRIAEIDLLILDELGRNAQTKGAEDAFFRLLDARYETVRPTAILSNLDKDGFPAALGEAAYDRLKQGDGKLINFSWDSYRGQKPEGSAA